MTCTRSTPAPASGARSSRSCLSSARSAGEIEYHGLDDQGIVHLRLERTAGGCQSTAGTIQTVIEQAVAAAAPEAAAVDIEVTEAPAELPLLQISRRPAGLQGAR